MGRLLEEDYKSKAIIGPAGLVWLKQEYKIFKRESAKFVVHRGGSGHGRYALRLMVGNHPSQGASNNACYPYVHLDAFMLPPPPQRTKSVLQVARGPQVARGQLLSMQSILSSIADTMLRVFADGAHHMLMLVFCLRLAIKPLIRVHLDIFGTIWRNQARFSSPMTQWTA